MAGFCALKQAVITLGIEKAFFVEPGELELMIDVGRKDEYFVEDDGWHKASSLYADFIEKNKDKKILFLELGVGWNTPAIIKYPFMKMTYRFPNAFYVCVNKGENYIPKEIEGKALLWEEDITPIIEALAKEYE